MCPYRSDEDSGVGTWEFPADFGLSVNKKTAFSDDSRIHDGTGKISEEVIASGIYNQLKQGRVYLTYLVVYVWTISREGATNHEFLFAHVFLYVTCHIHPFCFYCKPAMLFHLPSWMSMALGYGFIETKKIGARNHGAGDWSHAKKFKGVSRDKDGTCTPFTYVYYHGIYGLFSRDSWG